MERPVANVTAPGARVLVVVTGYFGDRLAQIFQRYGANVARIDVEWGRACDPAAVDARSRRRLPTSSPSCKRRRRPASSTPCRTSRASPPTPER